MKIRLGTRGSRLALIQARWTAARLAQEGHEPEIVIIKTTGDRVLDRAFAEVGAPGVFVAEIESALLANEIEVAVHSYKDLPSKGPEELVVAAVPERMDPADRMLIRPSSAEPGRPLGVKEGAVVGTASARRIALVQHLRPDCSTALLRGNLPTRVRKVEEGEYDAILLAAAGLDRVDRAAVEDPSLAISRAGVRELRLDPREFVPAPSQGALALQVNGERGEVREAIAALDDADVHAAVRAERSLLAKVEGGCQVPFGAWCQRGGDGMFELRTFLERDGRTRFVTERGDDPEALSDAAWSQLAAEVQ